jgi:hypothetical protein
MAVSFETLLTGIRRNLRDANGTTWSDAQLGELIQQGIDAVSSIYPNEGAELISYSVPTQGMIHSYALSSVNWPIRVDVYDAITKSATISNAVWSSATGRITYTYSGISAPGNDTTFDAGEEVTVTGVTPTGYNITGTIISSTTSTFILANTASVAAFSSGGAVSTTAKPKYNETIKPTVGEGADSGWDYFNGNLELPTHYAYSSNTGTLRVYGYKSWGQISPTYTTAGVAISPSTVTTDLNNRAQYAVKVFVAAEALSMLMFDRAQFQQWTVVGGNTDVTALGLNNLASTAQARWRLEKTRIRTIRRLG